jgi:O-antigen/teichoic acid export membrane protein
LGTCLTPVWSTGLLALHRHAALLVCNLIALLVIAALTLGLAPVIGARGAAVATVVGEWTIAISLLVALVRANRRMVPSARTTAPRVALAGAGALAMAALPVSAIVQLVLAVVVYASVIAALRALPRELVELLPGRSG